MRLIVDGKPIEFEAGDSILIAMLRQGEHPTGGGCLCLGGDCMHCLATVDGISYVRTCQTPAQAGVIVERHPADGYPPLTDEVRPGPEIDATHEHCDVVVIGQGESGRAEAETARGNGKSVITLDTAAGQDAVAIYAGPLVVARTADGMRYIRVRDEVIVATGAAEIQPVAPGAELAGIMTARAAAQLAAAGVELGRIVAVGAPPTTIDVTHVEGRIVRFEGDTTVTAVVVTDDAGNQQTYPCDTVAVGLGLHPRNALFRMGREWSVRAVGDAARESDIPPCPLAGTVCACSSVTVADLDYTWESGFRELELVKRSTLAGTGTCQGSACLPHIRSFIADRGKELQAPFTARPVTRQITMGEIAAGAHFHPTARTALDGIHRALGAQMERSGGWWRPWNYGDTVKEYWAVREAVSIMDVSTLGKMIISGPDALACLERIYPTQVATIRTGRSRYVLLLDERGYVMDDGMICKESDTRYTLTFTSGGASHVEMWLRDWSSSWGYDVRILNQTQTLGAINVTGPLAGELLARVGLTELPRYLRHRRVKIGDIPVHIFRLSFTGELSYELHHPAEKSAELWTLLMQHGADLGIRPHGLETLLMLRLEKGHIIVGQDTDFDSTPRRIEHEWAVKLSKEDFIGRSAILRTNAIPLDKLLVGLEADGDMAPTEGAIVWQGDEYVGYVTSSAYSHALGKSVMLAWLYYQDGQLPETVTIEGQTAQRVPVPFYDKESSRARA